MIVDHISHISAYRGLGPRFERAFAYLADFQENTPDGRYELDGDRVYALVQSIQTSAATAGVFESHKVYADIHFVVSGQEVIYYQETSLLNPRGDYDASIEGRLYDGGNENALHLSKGFFGAFWPQDGHKPGCFVQAPAAVRKIVMKIKLID